MPFSLIERYVFKKTLFAVLIAGLALISVVWIARAVQEIDVVTAKGQGIYAYLVITTLGVPAITAAIAPMALLIGLLHTLNTLNLNSELVVMNAAGSSRSVLLKPFMGVGLVVALLVMYLALWAGPSSLQIMRGYLNAVKADLISVAIREGAFRDVGKNMTFHVASRAPGGVLKGLFILDGRSDKETFTYLAEEGSLSKSDGDTFLILKRGQIQRLPANSNNLTIIEFDSYAFNLSSYEGERGPARTRHSELSTSTLLSPDKSNPAYLKHPERYSAEIMSRLTAPLYPLATVLIIVVLLGSPYSNRQGQVFEATFAAIIVVAVRAFGVFFEGVSIKQPAMLYAVWLLPVAAIVLPGLLLWFGKNTGPLRYFRKRFETLAFWLETQFAARLMKKKARSQAEIEAQQ